MTGAAHNRAVETAAVIEELIALELTDKLRKNLSVDWSVREAVRVRLRLMVKTILKRYKYPPDKQEATTEIVLRQAEALTEVWLQAA